MTAPVVLEFDPPAEVLNANDRLHWAEKAKRVRAWRTRAKVEAILAQRAGVLTRAGYHRMVKHEIGISIPVASLNIRRDGANWHPTLKAAIDGLVDHGMLPDDSGAFVVTSEPTFHAKADNPRVVVTITSLSGSVGTP